jgi:hypothetical protein
MVGQEGGSSGKLNAMVRGISIKWVIYSVLPK